jgi:DNA-binding IclR family transcriptional regulator
VAAETLSVTRLAHQSVAAINISTSQPLSPAEIEARLAPRVLKTAGAISALVKELGSD